MRLLPETLRNAYCQSPVSPHTHSSTIRSIALMKTNGKHEARNIPGASCISSAMMQQDRQPDRGRKLKRHPGLAYRVFQPLGFSIWSQERTEPEAEKRDKSMFPRKAAMIMLTQAGKIPRVSQVTSTYPVYPCPLSMCWPWRERKRKTASFAYHLYCFLQQSEPDTSTQQTFDYRHLFQARAPHTSWGSFIP
jgi:hypothetical protein